MSHPFDNFKFGPNVDIMDITTGKIINPFFTAIFGSAPKEPTSAELAAEAAAEQQRENQYAAKIANATMALARQAAADEYSVLPMSERTKVQNTGYAERYLSVRGDDVVKLIADIESGYSSKYINIKVDPESGSTTLQRDDRAAKEFPNMTLALAFILARYW
jgi:hypothetical protein